MACKKAVRESMFALVSLLATVVMVEVRFASVAFFICAHRLAPSSDCASQGYGQICRMCPLACSYVAAGVLNVFPARVRSSGSRDALGEVNVDAELEPHVLKMRGVSSATN